jgi:hypothetical protein
MQAEDIDDEETEGGTPGMASQRTSGLQHVRGSHIDMVEKVTAASPEEQLVQVASLVPHRVVRRYIADPNAVPGPASEEFEAAVLFADISGFTVLAEALLKEVGDGNAAAAAEKLSSHIGKCLSKMVDTICGKGGDVIKFAGERRLAGAVHSRHLLNRGRNAPKQGTLRSVSFQRKSLAVIWLPRHYALQT